MDFDLLKAHAIKKSKEFVYSHPEYRLSIWQKLRLKYFLFRRKQGYSVAAIVGHKEFYGLDFFVNKHVLIPRPDTELMVTEAIGEIKNNDKTILIDVGTGSGCIPISIACHLERSREIPYTRRKGFLHYGRNDIQIFAIDISGRALKVAKKNAQKHGVFINFFHGNLLEPILPVILAAAGIQTMRTDTGFPLEGNDNYVVITANLPYLTKKQFQNEPSIQREPKNALMAKNNGLALYEKLLQQIKSLFLIHHSSFIVLFEIDPSQAEAITKLISKYLPGSKIEIKKDLSGHSRLVKIF